MASPLPDPVDLGLVRRALVTKLRHHGDVLLASPVFTVLATPLRPREIDALVYEETAAMLAGHPAIARRSYDRSRMEAAGIVSARRTPSARCCRHFAASLRSDRSSDRTSPRGVAVAPAAAALQRRAPSRCARTGCGERASPITIGCRAGRRATPSNAISTACAASACSRRRATGRWSSRRTMPRRRACAACSPGTESSPGVSSSSTPVHAGCSNAGPPSITRPCSNSSRPTGGASR